MKNVGLVRMTLALVVGTLAATSAAAMCMGPGVFLAPAAGTALPENPTLFLFVPSFRQVPEVTARTEEGERPVTVSALSTGPALTSYQIRIEVEAGSVLSVHMRDPRRKSDVTVSRFAVVPSLQSGTEPVTILVTEAEIFHWTCSFQKTQNIRLSEPAAPAYRVEWSRTVAAYGSGLQQSVVVPATMLAFFDPAEAAAYPQPVLELGHVNCFGNTLEWPGEDPLYVGITALQTDGTERQVTDVPMRLLSPRRPLMQRFTEDYLRPWMYRMMYYVRNPTAWVP